MPTFGAFYLGREVSNSDKTIPDWAARELLDTIQKKGKGQQDIVIGAMYRGANVHTAYKAGGNEMAQLAVADKGIVTTSEKYTIAHSNHVGLKFVALKWQNVTDKIDVGDSSSDEVNYRPTEERYSGRHWQQDLITNQLSTCMISSFRHYPETGVYISRETWTRFWPKKYGCLNLTWACFRPMVRVVSCFITAISNIDILRLHLNSRDFILLMIFSLLMSMVCFVPCQCWILVYTSCSFDTFVIAPRDLE